MAAAGAIARVLIDSPLPQLDRLLDYRVPERLAEDAVPGVRVTVPLRTAGRLASGYLIELADSADFDGSLSEVETVVSPVPVLTPQVWALARKVADRCAGNASDVIRLAVPGRQVRVEKAWLAARAPARGGAETESATVPKAANATHRDAADSAPLTGYPPDRIEQAVASGERLAVRAIPRLVRLGRQEQTAEPGGSARADESAHWVGAWAVTMAQAAAHCLAGGRTAILVVPDYRDQDQLQLALAALVPADAVARVDARQSNPDRYRAFLSCIGGRPRIVIGNRSAVYAPAENLGLIAVWDDGDPLHNEPLSPYAAARDVALLRQEQQHCALMFLAHSRSVEVQRLVEVGWLAEVTPSPAVVPRVVVTAQQASEARTQESRIPPAAYQAATAALADRPVLVQVARPGYAPVLACRTCGQAARCRRCDGPLGISGRGSVPTCGWCGAIASDWSCTNCQGTALRLITRGAGRTAEELGRAFPGVRVIVADGERPVQNVPATPAIVVATRGAEPVAAGGYGAVLLLDGERMLARENLRVGDDCLRWWSNAAALAAPGAPVVLAGVGGGLGTALATWRQDAYARAELVDRRELRFPPAVRAASVTGRAQAVESAIEAIDPSTVIDALGPVPLGDGIVRTIVRFDYAHGAAVAQALRAAIIRNATSGRRPPRGGYKSAPTLKVRFDDPQIL
jgi:Primosomal protein N'' (replication factor Y) - superfamily II helicase